RNDKVPHRLIINGFKLSTISARLFFQDLTSPAKLTIVEGSIYIYAQQTVFLSLSDEIEPQGEKIILTSGQSVQFTREKIILTPKKDETIRFYNDTYLPGFIADDQYLHIGYAVVETGGFILKRHGRRYQVGVRSIPLMLHDTLITGLNDRVFIRLHTDDLLRLYANGTITIQEFPLPEKYPLLPLIIGVNAQEFTSKSSVGFQFKGRLRSRINPKIRNRRFRMRSTNAVIGVKGTDFEANNTSGKTEVLTISGKVELSDKEEKRSVLISQGMMSHIDENQAPLEPEKIPKELLHRLLRDSLDLEDQLQLSSFNTINPDNIILEADFSVSLYWNTVLSKAEIRLGNKTYPLKIAPNSVEIILNKKMFEGLALKEYKAEIKVMDIRKRSASLDVSLNLKPQMKTVKSKIELSDKIQFEKGGSIIKPESFTLLNEIIKTINENKQIRQVSIEGHTDSDGPEKRNKELSENRANAVRKYLIEHGVPGHILQTKGFGESIPISENTSQAGKAKNRRVEFIIETATLEEE
ncbi:OmpA family protein, partial [bacterium]|nr:OmpA family protein [bacterium]